MKAEKRDVQAKLAAMRAQAERAVAALEANLDANMPFGPAEFDALRAFVVKSADLGHAVDRLLTALEWEEGR